MLGVPDGWSSDHLHSAKPPKRVGVKLLHEVSPLQVAAGRVDHSLVVTIDGPNVARLLGLEDAACHIPLVIQRADGACTTHPELHSYDPSAAAAATARAFGETGTLDKLGLLYSHCMLKKMRIPPRSEESTAHAEFDQCGASFAVFGNLIQDWDLHPTK
jgi:hypothetical protein